MSQLRERVGDRFILVQFSAWFSGDVHFSSPVGAAEESARGPGAAHGEPEAPLVRGVRVAP